MLSTILRTYNVSVQLIAGIISKYVDRHSCSCGYTPVGLSNSFYTSSDVHANMLY